MNLNTIEYLLERIKEEGEHLLTEFIRAYGNFEKQVLDYRLNQNTCSQEQSNINQGGYHEDRR